MERSSPDPRNLRHVPAADALRAAITSAAPPPEVTAVDVMDDDETARVVYVAPSYDPTDDVNQTALENTLGGYLAVVKHHPTPPSRVRAVGTPPDENEDVDPLQWYARRSWAKRFLEGDWSELELLKRVAETSDTVVVEDG